LQPQQITDLISRVHLIQADGLNIVFDVNSGSLYTVDEIAWQLLLHYLDCGDWEQARERMGRLDQEEVEEAFNELQELISEGVLFSSGELWPEFVPGKELGIKALCLNIAHNCNLACRYCFVPEAIRCEEQIMSRETIKKALDFLLENTPYEYLTVDFFGGEPLLNFEGIKFAVDYALKQGKEKKWKFTVSTNTLLLGEEELSFFKEHNFSFVLSCDGRPQVHDLYRVTTGGQGSSAVVTRRIKEFLERGAADEYYIRGTFTRDNLDFTNDVLYLASLGAKSISMEPVVAPEQMPYALKEEDIPELQEEYYRLARVLCELNRKGCGVDFYHYNLDLTGGPCAAKRLTGCGAGYHYLAVTPAGDLYPCHQLVGNREYLLGDVEQGITAAELQEKFRESHIFRKKECSSCWARFLCGGGCHAQAIAQGRSLERPAPLACAVMQARLNGALYYLALKENTVETV